MECCSAGRWRCSAAVPTSSFRFISTPSDGKNLRKVEFTCRPSTFAWQIFDRIFTPSMCWGLSPATFLFLRMFSISTGFPVIADNVIALRIICPPPSPKAPSILIGSILDFYWNLINDSSNGNGLDERGDLTCKEISLDRSSLNLLLSKNLL